jgi:hypothetical protein
VEHLRLFTFGLSIGAAATALALWVASGVVGVLPPIVRNALLGVAAVAALLRDVPLIDFRLPENRRLIPKDLFKKSPGRTALQFGFELGTGLRTYVPARVPYVLATALLLRSPGLVGTLLAAFGFGLGRSIMTWQRWASADKESWDHWLVLETPWIVRGASAVYLVWMGTVLLRG